MSEWSESTRLEKVLLALMGGSVIASLGVGVFALYMAVTT